jgi:phosphonate transport system substrate-binding protein
VQTLLAQQAGYRVIAMAGSSQDFKGIFIVRKDSPLRQPQDLKGKVVSYPSPTALAGAIMPQYFLYSHGLDVQHDVIHRYVGSHESSILNTYMGHSAAAATWPPPWRIFQKDYPAEAAQLQVLWETPPLINNSVMVRRDVPPALQRQIQVLLLGLKTSADGPRILRTMETDAFFPADDKSYEVVQRYLTRFEKSVRPVQLKLH